MLRGCSSYRSIVAAGPRRTSAANLLLSIDGTDRRTLDRLSHTDQTYRVGSALTSRGSALIFFREQSYEITVEQRPVAPTTASLAHACTAAALITTSCYSTGSKKPHRCCHLANNFGSRRIFSALQHGTGDALSTLFVPLGSGSGIWASPTRNMIHWAHPSAYPKRRLNRFNRFYTL